MGDCGLRLVAETVERLGRVEMWVGFSDKLGVGYDSRKVGFQVEGHFFGGGPFIMSPLKREYMFLGAWMLGAQVRSGEFELSAGHQVDTGWSWVCIQRRSGLG